MQNNNSLNKYFGGILLALGLVWLGGNFLSDKTEFWSLVWPVFVLVPGLFFFFLYQSLGKDRHWGILIPGVYLTSLAVGFFINASVSVLFDYPTIWAWTSFMYIFALAITFGVVGRVSGKRVFLQIANILALISIFIFVIVGGFLFFFTILAAETSRRYWPVIIIIIGIIVLLGPSAPKILFPSGKYFGKSEEDWRKWGEEVGKEFEENK